jgi:hypothetical protein
MTGRIIASLAFAAGGVGTWFVMAAVRSFGTSLAAMSASAVSRPPPIDVLLPWLASSYFMVSAIGIVVCRQRQALRVMALLAHLLLLATFLAICSEGIGQRAEEFIGGVLLLGVITLLFFSPWLIVWSVFLFRCNEVA